MTINSSKILYGHSNDERFTPAYAVTPLLPYIKPNTIIWCPFDKPDSQFVKVLSHYHTVIYSHINTGEDFFSYTPDYFDVIISNPPFKNKRQFFQHAINLGKPFALLMSLTWLNDAAPKQLFQPPHDLQLLMFDKRIKYSKPDGSVENKITFSSAYFCLNFLPKQIIMHTLERN